MITTTLAAFPSPAQGVWHLTIPFLDITIPLRAYALFIILGIVVALMIGDRRWAARGGERGVIYDIALWAVPFGLIGGRLYHVLTDWKTYFGDGGAGPAAALRIWDGGLGIWGAVALGGVGAWIACRRRGIPLPAFGDAVAPGIVLAQAIGRVGNYFNQELYGRETTVPWGMEIFYRQDSSGIIDVHSLNGVSTGQVAAVVHPTFLYELLWNVLVFLVLIYVDRRFKMGHGRLFALYVAGYCIGRFCVELLRDDVATHLAGIRINSFTSTFVFIGAVVYIVLAPKGREDPATLGGTTHVDDEDDETVAPELVKELAAVAATTGVVAAATVAGREDEPYADPQPQPEAESEAEAEAEPVAEPEPEPEPDAEPDADAEGEPEADAEVKAEPDPEPDIEAEVEAEPEPESDIEAEVEAEPEPEPESGPAPEPDVEAAPEAEPETEPETEVQAEAEPAEAEPVPVALTEAEPVFAALQDPVDSSTEVVETAGTEPEEEPESEVAADPEPLVTAAEESVTEDAAIVAEPDSVPTEEDDAASDADDIEPPADDEAIVEAEVAAPGVEVLTGVQAEDADLIDDDHDPLDGDPEDFDSLDDAVADVSPDGPQSEQAEEIEESNSDPEVESDEEVDSDEDEGVESDTEVELDAEVDSDPEVESEPQVEVAVEPEDAPEPAVESVESAESTGDESAAAGEPDSPPRRRWWRRG